MKKSMYNYILSVRNAFVLFNSRTLGLLLLDSRLLKIYQEMQPTEIEASEQDFYKALCDSAMIVDDNLDEFAEVKNTLERRDRDNSLYP